MTDDLDYSTRIRLSQKHRHHLEAKARTSGKSKSRLIHEALAARFSYEFDDGRDARLIERLDMIMRHHHRHARDLNLLTESFSLFLQFFFTMAPQISKADQDVRAARGVGLLNQFIDQLGIRMKSGGKTFKFALDDVLVGDEDFFRLDELELLTHLKKKKQTPKIAEVEDA